MTMTIFEVPEKFRKYWLTLSDKSTYWISGEEKEGIMKSNSQFVELRTGEIVNKSFIVSISVDKEGTRKIIDALPEEERKILGDTTAVSVTETS